MNFFLVQLTAQGEALGVQLKQGAKGAGNPSPTPAFLGRNYWDLGLSA